jgi:peroxiredoxin
MAAAAAKFSSPTALAATLVLGQTAPDFDLPGVDAQRYNLACFEDKAVLVVMFTCNHCPYVQAYEARLIGIQRDYATRNVQLVAINSNDAITYPEDSFDRMIERAREQGYNFPYLRDDTQTVARAYGATHTPQVFVFNNLRQLSYAGRIDDNWKDATQVKQHDLRLALDALLAGKAVSEPLHPAIGCTVKWRPTNN